ncbi:PEP-CTERM system TPR-repeat protein PrsT [Alteromonadaceae bacterium BrNp21-10]|nr:PEP-CTERM system TPR-repeat protein PrsT [Alteromonadaceae bacterium BrNp21-10]
MHKLNSILCSTVLLLLLGGCTPNSPDEFKALAIDNIKNGKLSAAEIDLKNLIQISPSDIEARLLLANLYFKTGNLSGSEKEYYRFLDLGGDKQKIINNLVLLDVFSYEFESAVEKINQYDLTLDDNLLILKTLLLLAQNNTSEALLAFEQIGKASDSENTLNIINHLINADIDQATTSFEATPPMSSQPELMLVLGMANGNEGKFKNAIKLLKQYHQARPQNKITPFLLANSLISNKQYDEASTYVTNILRNTPNNPLGNSYAALIHYHEKDFTQALSYASKSIDAGMQSPTNRFIKGISSFQVGLFEQALAEFQTLKSAFPQDDTIATLLSSTQLRLGYTESAANTIMSVNALNEDAQAIMMQIGLQMYKDGQVNSAKAFASKLDPELNDDVRLTLFKQLLNIETELDVLEKSLSESPNDINLTSILASQYINNNQSAEAVKLVESYIVNNPNDLLGHILAGNIYLKLKQTENAKNAYLAAEEIKPNNAGSLLFKITLLEEQNKIPEAINIAKQLITHNPNNKNGYIKLYQLSKKSHDVESMLSFLDSLTEFTKVEDNQLFIATLLADQKMYKESLTRLSPINTPKLQLSKLVLEGQNYANLNRREDAIKALEKALELQPYNKKALVALIPLYNQGLEYQKSLEIISSARKQLPNDMELLYWQATVQVASGNALAAKSTLDKLKRENSNLAISSLEGKVLLATKQYEQALPFLLISYNAKQSTSNALDLAVALKRLDRSNDAITLLEKHLEHFPLDSRMRMFLAEIYLKSKPASAVAHYEYLLEHFPDLRWLNLNNLAWAYKEQGMADEALTTINQALKLAPSKIELLDTKATIFEEQEDYQSALKVLSAKVDSQTTIPDTVFKHYIELLLKAGDKNTAFVKLNNYNGSNKALIEMRSTLITELEL